MAIRSKLVGGVSMAAFSIAISAALPAAAFAQDAGEDEAAAADADDADENNIIVSGFRQSLESAVSEKRLSDQILESVTAEDIGRLPDASIGESIARLPGVTSQRTNGRANVIAIRGFGPDFSTTLLNGREQTSTNDGRGVEFDQYPSEVVNQVVVYKSPTASLIGQGMVGTVDIRTIRPLEVNEKIMAVGARASYADLGKLNSGSDDLGYRVNATFVDQFADDTLGISLATAYVDEPYQVQEFNAWGYNGGFGPANVINGSKSYVTSTGLKRFGINGTLQYEPSPEWMVTLDGFYSHFDDDQIKRGIELPVGWFGTTFDPSTATVEDGVYVTGTLNNVQGVVRNDVFNRKADLYSFGFNTTYEGDDGWSGFIDFGYSRSDRNELSFESYAGTGFNWDNPFQTGDEFAAGDAVDSIGFTTGRNGTFFNPTLDYSDPNLIVLTDPLGWGGSLTVPQAGYFNDRKIVDELKQYRAEIEKEIGGLVSSVKAGVAYTDRDKSLTPDEYFIRLAGGATELTIPSDLLLRPTDLSYLGLGPMVSYDPRALIADGTYVLTPNTSFDIPAKAFNITEDVLTMYLQADIDQDLGASVLTGNVGVQVVNTDQGSSGIVNVAGVQTPTTIGKDYWDVLPSLNLSLRMPSDTVLRFAVSRQMQRPRLDDLRIAIGYGLNNTVNESPTGQVPFISGGGGNPLLEPYRATAFDFNVEQYFAGGQGVVAAQFFYKKITNWIAQARLEFDYTGFPLPAGQQPATLIGTLDSKFNVGGGKMYGGELSATLPFDVFSEALDGFGVTGGLGYTETKVRDFNGNVEQIPGYSKWVANGTAYYEKGGFNARGSVRYRSTFLGDFTGFGGSPTRRTALAETIVDAQIGYDFDSGPLDGLSLYLQGQNLTDERFASIDSNPLQVIDYQTYGRRFLAGFTYRF